MNLRLFLFIVFLVGTPSYASIRICTQNLENFGFPNTVKERVVKTESRLNEQKLALARNFYKAKCDLIATQEVISKNPSEAVKVLNLLALRLTELTGKKYGVVSGKSNDPLSKQGYIIRKDIFRLENAMSYSKYQLEPLTRWEKNRYFSRGPLRIDLTETKTGRQFTLFNFHFKSQAAYDSFDSSKFGFEYDRLQMAQGLYDIAHNLQNIDPNQIIILMGDRNSANNSASANVLSGKLDITHFQQGLCSLSKDQTASCKSNLERQPEYISILEQAGQNLYKNGTYSKKFKRIDDILISTRYLVAMPEEKREKIAAGMLPVNREASDHPLFYIDLN